LLKVKEADMSGMRGLLVASIVAIVSACELEGFDNDDSGLLFAGAMGGLVLGILMIILVSLHLCRGVLKRHGKVVAAIAVVLGVVASFISLPWLMWGARGCRL